MEKRSKKYKILALILLDLLIIGLCIHVFTNENYFNKNSLASKRKKYIQVENNTRYKKQTEILNEVIDLMERDDFQKLLDEKLIEYGTVGIDPMDFIKNKYGDTYCEKEPTKKYFFLI